MSRIARLLVVVIVSVCLTTNAFAAKKYQVTGVITKLTDKIITIEKGAGADKETWEIDRDADTKVKGDLKEGAKVTIEYKMTATDVEVKDAK